MQGIYRILFNEAPVGLALCRMDDGSYVAVNKAFAAILARPRRNDETIILGGHSPAIHLTGNRATPEARGGRPVWTVLQGVLPQGGVPGSRNAFRFAFRVGECDFIWSIVEKGVQGSFVWQGDDGPPAIYQVLLLKNEKSMALGPALWAGLQEVELFFNGVGNAGAAFERFYLAEHIPPGLGVRLPDPDAAETFENDPLWEDATGHYEGTYKVKPLIEIVQA